MTYLYCSGDDDDDGGDTISRNFIPFSNSRRSLVHPPRTVHDHSHRCFVTVFTAYICILLLARRQAAAGRRTGAVRGRGRYRRGPVRRPVTTERRARRTSFNISSAPVVYRRNFASTRGASNGAMKNRKPLLLATSDGRRAS